MKGRDIFDAMRDIDSQLILDAAPSDTDMRMLNRRSGKKLLLAASIALVIVALSIVNMLSGGEIPIYDTPFFSANEIGALFSSTKDSVATNSYVPVYVPSPDMLLIEPFTEEEYITLFGNEHNSVPLDEGELSRFADGILPSLSKALGGAVPEYTVELRNSLWTESSLTASGDVGKYTISMAQTGDRNSINVYVSAIALRRITLNKTIVKVDQTQSDKEIIASLTSVKDLLFDIFNVDFADAKVVRKYGDLHEYGVTALTVYFYDADAHPMNAYVDEPVSDYIKIRFNNLSEDRNAEMLTNANIMYSINRTDEENVYSPIAKVKMLSLKEGEELLYKGYVFGNHRCNLCMESQDVVDFSGYDFVELEYITGKIDRLGAYVGVPFYTFYKHIGTSHNGNEVYAKTHVPAVELSELSDYFTAAEQYHR